MILMNGMYWLERVSFKEFQSPTKNSDAFLSFSSFSCQATYCSCSKPYFFFLFCDEQNNKNSSHACQRLKTMPTSQEKCPWEWSQLPSSREVILRYGLEHTTGFYSISLAQHHTATLRGRGLDWLVSSSTSSWTWLEKLYSTPLTSLSKFTPQVNLL